MTNPTTYNNYKKEMEEANFSQAEIVRIINGVLSANGLDEERVEEAKKRFLALQQVPKEKPLSQPVEPLNT